MRVVAITVNGSRPPSHHFQCDNGTMRGFSFCSVFLVSVVKSSQNEHIVRFNLGKFLSHGSITNVFLNVWRGHFPRKIMWGNDCDHITKSPSRPHHARIKQINGKLCNFYWQRAREPNRTRKLWPKRALEFWCTKMAMVRERSNGDPFCSVERQLNIA